MSPRVEFRPPVVDSMARSTSGAGQPPGSGQRGPATPGWRSSRRTTSPASSNPMSIRRARTGPWLPGAPTGRGASQRISPVITKSDPNRPFRLWTLAGRALKDPAAGTSSTWPAPQTQSPSVRIHHVIGELSTSWIQVPVHDDPIPRRRAQLDRLAAGRQVAGRSEERQPRTGTNRWRGVGCLRTRTKEQETHEEQGQPNTNEHLDRAYGSWADGVPSALHRRRLDR